MSLLRRTMDYDPETKTRTIFHDLGDDKYAIETVQDVEDLLDHNKAQLASVDERARWGGGQKVASIPMALYFDLKRRGIADDKKKFAAWLNDPENRYFRTRPGRV